MNEKPPVTDAFSYARYQKIFRHDELEAAQRSGVNLDMDASHSKSLQFHVDSGTAYADAEVKGEDVL